MEASLKSVALLIIKFLFDSYLFLLLLRLLLQKYRAPFYNPISLFVIRLTDPLVLMVRRFIPGCRGFDLAIVFWLLLLQMIAFFIVLWISLGLLPHLLGIPIMAIGELGDKWVNLLFFAIIVAVIISWFPALQSSPIALIAQLLADPPLSIGRRFIPPLAGFDLSPIVVLLVLKLLSIFVFYPILNFGTRIAIT